jgi:acylaminoacyl-peptidase
MGREAAARLAGFEFSVEIQTDDNLRWIVVAHKAEQPATYYLLDRGKQSLTELFRARPALVTYQLAPMDTVQTKSRDGLDLVSYLTFRRTSRAIGHPSHCQWC